MIAAIDVETLMKCPARDWDNARSVANIMLFNWLYQSALFVMINHRLFARPGELRPELVLASVLLATFLLSIDRYMVILSGWHLSGIQELKRGGIDISGGPLARVKAGCFLIVRILLSIGNAQLSAIFLSLFIFGSDIDSRVQSVWLQANGPLISEATRLVDAQIQRASEAVDTQTAEAAKMASQVNTLRQNSVDPSANNPDILQAQKEVAGLIARKAQAEDELRQAETFAANELGGIKGASGNSGRPGYGLRYRAAMEQVASAKARLQKLTTELDAARARLETLRMQTPTANDALKQQAHEELPEFERRLADGNARLTELKNELAALTTGREDAIRKAVEAAPNHVGFDRGFLAQVRVLEELAKGSTIIWSVIALIDVVSFGFELAAVLVKITSYVPTTYTALLARDCYMAVRHVVERMFAELDGMDGHETAPPQSKPNGTTTGEAASTQDSGEGPVRSSTSAAAEPSNTEPPRRRRGRPRKHPIPDPPSRGLMGKSIQSHRQKKKGESEIGELPESATIP